MRLSKLQRGPHGSSWSAPFPPIPTPVRRLFQQYLDELRETFARAREGGMLEALLADQLGRTVNPQRVTVIAKKLGHPLQASLGKMAGFLSQPLDEVRKTFAHARQVGLREAELAGWMRRVVSPPNLRPTLERLTWPMRGLTRAPAVVGATVPRVRRAGLGLVDPVWALMLKPAYADAALRTVSVAGVLTAAAVLRVLDLGRIGFNSDEAVYSGQAAALLGDSTMAQSFSVFRAHPLLLQTLLSGLFGIVGISDLAARLLVALAFGVGSVALTYLLANRFYGHRVGFAAAALMAVLPYHVLVSRQVLLDTPLAFFVLLTLWFVAKGNDDRSGRWMIWAGISMGLAAAAKEVGVLLLPVIGAYLVITDKWRQVPLRPLIVGLALFTIIVSPYPLSRLLFAPETGSSFFLWQLSRPPNHEASYFVQVLFEFTGVVFMVLALLGLVYMAIRLRRDTEVLILLWIAVFFGFFQIWPTKLFSYLMVVVPAFCIAAAVGLDIAAQSITSALRSIRWSRWLLAETFIVPIALVILAIYLGHTSLTIVQGGTENVSGPLRFDIEVQEFAGGREVAYWARDHTPPEGRFLTIGPSMGNILRFYSDRESVALSVSSDPRQRNPAYVPVPNPDLWFRQLGLHYIIWDFYSADRSAFYNARLMHYVRKYGGAVLYGVYEQLDGSLYIGAEPPKEAQPRIVVYDAAGGDPLEASARGSKPVRITGSNGAPISIGLDGRFGP